MDVHDHLEESRQEEDLEDTTYTVDDAIERCGGFGRFQWIALLFAGLSWMCDAFEVMLLSFLGPAVECEWELTPAQVGSLTSAVFAGSTIGGPLWGAVSDGFGRKPAFAASVVCTTIAGFASAAAPSFAALAALRFFVGLGIPGACVSFGLLMELVPAQSRGVFLIAIEGFWTVGTVAQAGLAYALLNTRGWRVLVAVSAAPLLVQLAMLPLVPESPRYLLVKGKTKEAEQALRRVLRACGKELPPGHLRPLKAAVEADEEAGPPDAGRIPVMRRAAAALARGARDIGASARALVAPPLLTTTASLLFIWFTAALVYYGAVQLAAAADFMGSSDRKCDGPRMVFPRTNLLAILATGAAEVPGLALSLILAQLLGRKHSFALPMAAVAASLAPAIAPQRLSRGAAIACLWLARLFVYCAYNILWAVTPELFPTQSRSVALGLTNAISRIGGVVSPFTAVVAPRQHGPGTAEAILASFSIAAAAAIYLLPRDTRGQRVQDTLEEAKELAARERADTLAARAGKPKRGPRWRRGGGEAAADAAAAEAGGSREVLTGLVEMAPAGVNPRSGAL